MFDTLVNDGKRLDATAAERNDAQPGQVLRN